MPILTRRALIAAKIETVEGTAETLAGADANILVIDPKFTPTIALNKRQNVASSLSQFAQVPGTQMAEMTFGIELKGSGAAGTAPALGKLLKACGFGETVVASTSVTYDPISTAVPSMTIALYRDGLKKQLRGARGTVTYNGNVGEFGILQFTFNGVYDGVTDVALLTQSGVETTIPQPLLLAAFTIAAFAAKVKTISLDVGNTLAMRTDISKAEGYFSCLISGREAKGSFDPEEELVATHDWHGRFKAGTTGALTFKHGASAGNIATLTAPALQYSSVAEGDRDGISALTVGFNLVRSAAAGDDELRIAFT